MTNGILINN